MGKVLGQWFLFRRLGDSISELSFGVLLMINMQSTTHNVSATAGGTGPIRYARRAKAMLHRP